MRPGSAVGGGDDEAEGEVGDGGGEEDWTKGPALGPNATTATLRGLTAGESYLFRVGAAGSSGVAFSRSAAFTLADPPPAGSMTGCAADETVAALGGGYDVRACFETPSGARMDASNYHLEASASGLLYFFDRDNVEVLVKVLDGCAVNGHRWVFVAPVTDLAFNLEIVERATGRRFVHRNPKGLTAEPRSDTAAFPCQPEESAAAASASGTAYAGDTGGRVPVSADGATPRRDSRGAREARGPAAAGGGTGPGHADFFDRDNAEVLVKVLDGCAVNGHRWVFAAPVTDLAFNLVVTQPDGSVWTHRNQAGKTARPRSDADAFPCR